MEMNITQQSALPKVSQNPINYLRAYWYMGKAIVEVKGATGFRPDGMPEPVIYTKYGNWTIAQLYDKKMIVWDPKVSLRSDGDVIPHEVFHYAQERYRARSGDPESELRFVLSQSTKAGVMRAAVLWNGANEAGAYVFGYRSMYKRQYSGPELTKKILRKLIEWNGGQDIDEIKTEVLDLIFMRTELKSYEDQEVMRRLSTPVITAIILEQNHFDTIKTVNDLLQSPDKTIERIKALGYDGALKSLENARNFMLN